MSVFHGKQGPGAMRKHREFKRIEADARNKMTPPERRSTKSKPQPKPKKTRRGTRGKKEAS